MARKRNDFWDSLYNNKWAFFKWYYWLLEIAISRFKWTGLPETIDPRFLELTLFGDGQAVLFKDEILGFLGLQVVAAGPLDVYRVPTNRRAYSTTAYQKQLGPDDSVLVYNNMARQPGWMVIKDFAQRLWNYDRVIDVNVNAQKTPVLIICDEEEKLSMLNVYQKWDGNEPVIMGRKGINATGFQSLTTGAPYVAANINQLKTDLINEALTFLGVANYHSDKKERVTTDEVDRAMGGVLASRYSALTMRQNACNEFNTMFGTNIWCEYREELDGEETEKQNQPKQEEEQPNGELYPAT